RWSIPAHWDRLLAADREQGHITWIGYGAPDEDIRDVLPLRRLSPVDADRVKAYRRHLHEGILPPALLWWVSGLNTLLVIDGHDRIREYEGRIEHLQNLLEQGDTLAKEHIANETRRLAADLGEISRSER